MNWEFDLDKVWDQAFRGKRKYMTRHDMDEIKAMFLAYDPTCQRNAPPLYSDSDIEQLFVRKQREGKLITGWKPYLKLRSSLDHLLTLSYASVSLPSGGVKRRLNRPTIS